jgi:hypothetical protein
MMIDETMLVAMKHSHRLRRIHLRGTRASAMEKDEPAEA